MDILLEVSKVEFVEIIDMISLRLKSYNEIKDSESDQFKIDLCSERIIFLNNLLNKISADVQ